MKPKLTYANVMVTILAFIVLGGSAIAAIHLGKNSVGPKQIKKNAVTGAKVKNHSLTGKDIKLSKLGKVPLAAVADTANSANGLAPPEAVRLVGTPGQPPFLDGSANFPVEGGVAIQPVGFYKDHEGIVHIEGGAKSGTEENPIKGLVFQLPPGYRPANATIDVFAQGETGFFVFGSHTTLEGKNLEGDVVALNPKGAVFLNGIFFRAQS